MPSSTSREIDDLAADWAAKCDAGALDTVDEAALDAWLAEDPRHLGAFAKARAVSLRAGRAQVLGPAAFARASHKISRRRMVLTGGIAASAAAVVGGAGIAYRLFATPSFATQIGETRIVPLDDGSVITLNTDSRVVVDYSPNARNIRLTQGEALFDVAKNRGRPFVVDAAGTLVRAVGTSFTVSLLPEEPVQVLVREGVVEVKRPDSLTLSPVRLSAGTKAIAALDAPVVTQRIAKTEVARALAWRVGRLAFEGETLAEAAQTFSRYSDTHIVIDDPEVAKQTITGLFVSNDPIGFARAVAVSLNLRAEVRDNTVWLAR